MGVFDIYKKLYCSILNGFFRIFYFLGFWRCKNASVEYGKFLTHLPVWPKEGAKKSAQINNDQYDLFKQIEDLKQALKSREEFTKQLQGRYQESIIYVRELMEISNKLAKESKDLFSNSCEVNLINRQIEQALKSLESGYLVPLVISTFKIHDLIDEIIDLFSLEMYKKNSQVLNVVKSKELYIQSDLFLLKKLLIYLLLKAFKRLPKNGKVEIDSRVVKGNVMIRLCDNGYFLDEDIRGALFNDRECDFMSKHSFMGLVKRLKGKVDFAYTSKEKHEVKLWFPLKWDEHKVSKCD